MTKFRVLFAIVIVSYSFGSFSAVQGTHAEILQVIEEMDAAWADQDLRLCLSYFSEDTDFENGYGWSIRGREAMGEFLSWLFKQFPKQDLDSVQISSVAEVLTPDLVMVERAKRIPATNNELPARTYRATYHLRRENGTWMIWKTRIWELRSRLSTPLDSVAPSRFPEMFNDEKDDDT